MQVIFSIGLEVLRINQSTHLYETLINNVIGLEKSIYFESCIILIINRIIKFNILVT